MKLPTFPLLAALAIVVGCGPAPGNAGTSATLVEQLRIDGYDADLVPIAPVGDPGNALVVDRHGIIAVAQSQDRRIRFFDALGKDIGSVGGEGEGPGEFRVVIRIGLLGDTLWAFDGRLDRITLFSPTRALAGTIRLPAAARPAPSDVGRIPEFPYVRPMLLLPGGSIYAGLGLSVGADVPDHFKNHEALTHITRDGIIEKVIARVPIGEVQLNTPAGEAFSLPFPNPSFEGVSQDASRTAFAIASLEGENAGTFLVTVLGAQGDTVFSRRYPFDPVPIPGAVRDSVSRRQRRELPTPSIYPPLAGLVVGRDGTTWIEMIPTSKRRPYLVLDLRGDPVGTILLPSNSRIAIAQSDEIWVLERDEVDVERVVRYGVTWRRGITAQ